MAEGGAGPAPRPDPARAVEGAFARAAARMRALPICNPALRVEAVGVRAFEGEWLGAIVSPWTLSLFIVPGDGGRFRRLGPDERQRWSFPLGDCDFLGAEDPALGAYQTCSLVSPPWALATHDDAREAALAALDALLAPRPVASASLSPAASTSTSTSSPTSTPTPTPTPPGADLGRRGFLAGAWRRRGR